jgi:hypothetical protein
MDFGTALLEVLVGAFVMFTVSRATYGRWVPGRGWRWVLFVGALALGNMLLHRWLGSTINPPFFTAVLFAVTLVGLVQEQSVVEGEISAKSPWLRRGLFALVIGTALGWVSYVEVGTAL